MLLSRKSWLAASAALLLAAPAGAVVPYTPAPVRGPLVPGPGITAPKDVYGKEYSHDTDFSVASGVPTPDPQQVLAWDGIGGTMDGVDFSGTRPSWEVDQQVDAIAHHRDALFDELRFDEAHLVFSHDDMVTRHAPGGPFAYTVPSGGPVFLSNGNAIGGAGEVSTEHAGLFAPPATQHTWATQPEVNAMPFPVDVDGVELWGPEPAEFGDSDKYSLDLDFASGVSVWNGSGSAYIPHPMIIGAVTSLLGPIPGPAYLPYDNQEGQNAINLDALMVQDMVGDIDVFDTEFLARGGEGDIGQSSDAIIFSIRQIVDTADPDGYYATGSELFVLDALGGVSFLFHGGHFWDHAYSLTDLRIFDEQSEQFGAVIDINAIEAVAMLPLAGDYNLDGSVNGADYTLWRDTEGAAGFNLPADGNADMVVDSLDYDIWVANYGATSPSLATSVPEPGSLMLLSLAALGLVVRRR